MQHVETEGSRQPAPGEHLRGFSALLKGQQWCQWWAVLWQMVVLHPSLLPGHHSSGVQTGNPPADFIRALLLKSEQISPVVAST